MGSKDKYKDLLYNTKIPNDTPPKEYQELATPIMLALKEVLPKQLFRYRICNENNFDALLNDKIFFSPANRFNDPYDCVPYVNMPKVRDMLDKYTIENEVNIVNAIRKSTHLEKTAFSPNVLPATENYYSQIKAMSEDEITDLLDKVKNPSLMAEIKKEAHILIDDIENALFDNYVSNSLIACFSENISSILMWAHYTDSHKGFAIEYEPTSLFEYNNQNTNREHLTELFPVLYGKERFESTDLVIDLLQYNLYKANTKSQLYVQDGMFSTKINTSKEISWKYEKEWRMFYHNQPKNFNASTNYSIVIKPKAIYLGTKISDINKFMLMNLVKDKNVEIYQMKLSFYKKTYRLDAQKIKM